MIPIDWSNWRCVSSFEAFQKKNHRFIARNSTECQTKKQDVQTSCFLMIYKTTHFHQLTINRCRFSTMSWCHIETRKKECLTISSLRVNRRLMSVLSVGNELPDNCFRNFIIGMNDKERRHKMYENEKLTVRRLEIKL